MDINKYHNESKKQSIKNQIVERADFKIKLVEVLEKTKGVGPKTFDNIMRTVKELGI